MKSLELADVQCMTAYEALEQHSHLRGHGAQDSDMEDLV
jgi:hypothetical protein